MKESTVLYWVAENIITHLEAVPGGLTKQAHGTRLELVTMVQSILVESLTSDGFVRIERPNGRPFA